MSAAVFNGTNAAGLNYVSGSCAPFGNNGTTSLGDSVNQSANTALNDLQGPITVMVRDLTAQTATNARFIRLEITWP